MCKDENGDGGETRTRVICMGRCVTIPELTSSNNLDQEFGGGVLL